MSTYMERPLDIHEILSRDDSQDVVTDAYEYAMRKCNGEPLAAKDDCVRDFLLYILFNAEVDNGGISQFLFNYSGDRWEETLAALKKLNSRQAEILSQALSCFPRGNVPKDLDQRNELMEAFDQDTSDRFDQFDDLLYGCQNERDAYDYLMEHKDIFLNL